MSNIENWEKQSVYIPPLTPDQPPLKGGRYLTSWFSAAQHSMDPVHPPGGPFVTLWPLVAAQHCMDPARSLEGVLCADPGDCRAPGKRGMLRRGS